MVMFFSGDVRKLSPVSREGYKLVRRVLTQTPVCHGIGPKNEAKMVTVTHKHQKEGFDFYVIKSYYFSVYAL